MKRVLFICMLLSLMCVLPILAAEEQEPVECNPSLYANETGDQAFVAPNPLVKKLREAREHGDMDVYNALLEEYKQTLSPQPTDAPTVYGEMVNTPASPVLRWGNDVTIYGGDVYYNSWAMLLGVDDESIDLDCHVGDTLIAAVACADSLVRVFKSFDNGMTWSYYAWWSVGGHQFLEPEIIYTEDGVFHCFLRNSWNNGTVMVINCDGQFNWTAPYVTNSSDTIPDYTVCSDRADYNNYWFYLMYHRQLGGAGADAINFTRSLDHGETWETPQEILINGSCWPDITYGSSGDLHMTRLWYQSGGNKLVRTMASLDLGVTWGTSVTIFSDTTLLMGPQIAASHDGTQDAWIIFPRHQPNTDYGLLWSWSQDNGATWSGCAWTNSYGGYQEVLPDIKIHDGHNDSLYYPYVSFIRSVDDWTVPNVYSFNWASGDSWSHPASSFNDNEPEFVRPVQTWELPGVPAMAYVGSGGVNAYFDSWTSAVEEESPVAQETSLGKAHPNPFSARTRIELTLPRTSSVSVKAYNILGQEVSTIFNGIKNAGTHSIEWKGVDNNGNRLPSGIYFMRIKTPYHTSSKKLILQ